MKGEIGCLVAR